MSAQSVSEDSRSQSRTVEIGRGVFALRYVASAAKPDSPRVFVEPVAEIGLSIISSSGGSERVLEGPGTFLLIHSDRPSRLTLTVVARMPGSSLDAELVLEPAGKRDRRYSEPLQIAAAEIEILAHLAGRGDAKFAAGSWIGGPDMPTRIEGLMIRWHNRPADVDLNCTVVSRGRRLERFVDRPTGEFAGTRGEAAPIVGLALNLVGGDAGRYALSGEAQFLGSPAMSKTGAHLSFASRSARDPLVGLKLSIAVVRSVSGRDDHAPSETIDPSLIGRVRMFRGTATPIL
jgi:hypothetical protein